MNDICYRCKVPIEKDAHKFVQFYWDGKACGLCIDCEELKWRKIESDLNEGKQAIEV